MAWTQVIGNALGLTREMFESQLTAGRASCPTPRERAGKKMIEVDLARTFSAEGRFREAVWQESLRQVLEAFIHYRPELGYVQGMSFLAAVLLSHTDAGDRGHASGNADAFPAFCALSNLLCPQENRVLSTLLRLEVSSFSCRTALSTWLPELPVRCVQCAFVPWYSTGSNYGHSLRVLGQTTPAFIASAARTLRRCRCHAPSKSKFCLRTTRCICVPCLCCNTALRKFASTWYF